MRTVKDLVVFQEIWKEAHVHGGDKLARVEDEYYALYLIMTPVEAQEDIMHSFQTNTEMFRLAVQDCQMKSVKRFKDDIIRCFEKRFYEEAKIPKFLNYENRIYTDDGVCVYNENETKMWIATPVYIKYCRCTDHNQIERLRKDGKILG